MKSTYKKKPKQSTVSASNIAFYLIFASTLLLVLFGTIMVFTSSAASQALVSKTSLNALTKQCVIVIIGMFLAIFVIRLGYHRLQKMTSIIYAVCIGLQLLLLVPGMRVEIGGNAAWLNFRVLTFQPSESAKIAMILAIAVIISKLFDPAFYKKYQKNIKFKIGYFVAAVALILTPILLVVLIAHDFGSALTMCAIAVVLLFFWPFSRRTMAIIVGLVGVVAFAIYNYVTTHLEEILSSNRGKRLYYWLNCSPTPEGNMLDDGCLQSTHGIWAFVGNGITGRGVGDSLESWHLLPERESDYIFSIVGEETGLFGVFFLLALFLMYTVGCWLIIIHSKDKFIQISTVGFLVFIVGQAMINMAVVLKIFPIFGIALPFISAGGSSMLCSMVVSGILILYTTENSKN
ncbi:MAG: FtsW/RodA/SpoVE family cell cycle protein [Bifidobacteriaceae bacterium]|jgi:cell division protein FtsW|nr:FtsW/RodA/SpoVE family cell cycle protein [Bifidobacteriaceae bacterium]